MTENNTRATLRYVDIERFVAHLNEVLEQEPCLARQFCLPIGVTSNKQLAHESPMVFGSPDKELTFHLSMIGFVNGLLPENKKISWMQDEDGRLQGFCVQELD